jgi:hypothetical protein
MFDIQYLLNNSNLPGPRGNLELLHSFIKSADMKTVETCLGYITPDTTNSPEEFAGMCGVTGYAWLNKNEIEKTMEYIRKYASHSSWRIREAVAIGIQEIANPENMKRILDSFEEWISGNELEKRALAAALCEPKLLYDKDYNLRILNFLSEITDSFKEKDKLTDNQKTLRKTLGYAWSVLIVYLPAEGKKVFESYKNTGNKHIKWIMNENLKKNRLTRMDEAWVKKMKELFNIN